MIYQVWLKASQRVLEIIRFPWVFPCCISCQGCIISGIYRERLIKTWWLYLGCQVQLLLLNRKFLCIQILILHALVLPLMHQRLIKLHFWIHHLHQLSIVIVPCFIILAIVHLVSELKHIINTDVLDSLIWVYDFGQSKALRNISKWVVLKVTTIIPTKTCNSKLATILFVKWFGHFKCLLYFDFLAMLFMTKDHTIFISLLGIPTNLHDRLFPAILMFLIILQTALILCEYNPLMKRYFMQEHLILFLLIYNMGLHILNPPVKLIPVVKIFALLFKRFFLFLKFQRQSLSFKGPLASFSWSFSFDLAVLVSIIVKWHLPISLPLIVFLLPFMLL